MSWSNLGCRSRGFLRQTLRALHTSNPQLKALVPATNMTPAGSEVNEMTKEIEIGARSLHRRSIRRMTVLRWVRLYADSPLSAARAARVGTQSRSIEIMLPTPLNFSQMPRPITMVKSHSLPDSKSRKSRPGITFAWAAGLRSSPGRSNIQQMHANITAIRFAEIVTSSILNLEEPLSIQLPTEEDKKSAAKVVQRPLVIISPSWSSYWPG